MRVVSEGMVHTPCKSAAKPKGERQSSKGDRGRGSPIANQKVDIRFEANEEEVQDKTEVGDEVEVD